MSATPFADLDALAAHLRQELQKEQDPKKFILLYAYNGTGKTRLSTAFKDLGKKGDERDTLYFNAFTEDLFTWDNDLEEDKERVLKLNTSSRFFSGLKELELESRIRPFLRHFVFRQEASVEEIDDREEEDGLMGALVGTTFIAPEVVKALQPVLPCFVGWHRSPGIGATLRSRYRLDGWPHAREPC